MQALLDASPSFAEVVNRIRAEDPDTKLDGITLRLLLFWFSRALIDDDIVQRELTGDKPYTRLVADLARTTKDGKGVVRESKVEDGRLMLQVFPELEGAENKPVVDALLNVTHANTHFMKIVRSGNTSGVAVTDLIEQLQTRVRDAFIKHRKSVRSVGNEPLSKKLRHAFENHNRILQTPETSATTTTTKDGNTKASSDAVLEKIKSAQKQQFTGAVTRDFMVGLAETGSKDLQQMLGTIDTRAKEFAAHTLSVTFLLTESFRTFSDLLRRANPGRVLREYEQIVRSLEPLAPDKRQQAAAAFELERAYAETRLEIEEEFARMQDRIALALERVDRVRAEATGSQYTWEGAEPYADEDEGGGGGGGRG